MTLNALSNKQSVEPENVTRESFLIGDEVLCCERKSVSVFLPSLEEIALHCERFQASWTEAERYKRMRGWQPH